MVCPQDDEENSEGGSGGDTTAVITDTQAALEQEAAKDKPPCLIVIRGQNQGQQIYLTHVDTLIGREGGGSADLTFQDQSISRKHAKITKNGNIVTITDVGSSNGTFINNKRINANQPIRLEKEDLIKLGSTIVKFLPAGELEAVMHENLINDAHRDGLTGIYNKAYLLGAIAAEFKRAQGLGTAFSIVFFDLDHFKKVNDTYGHDAGDYVLKTFCSLVASHFVQDKEIFARYGGEEFVLLLPAVEGSAANVRADKIRTLIEGYPFVYEGVRLKITTSLGVAQMTGETLNHDALLKKADENLYKAKSGGRNCVVFD